MNVYDAERMADILRALGYGITTEPDEAQLVIFNSCHIREKAAEKIYSELGRLGLVKEKITQNQGDMIVAVAGCVAQAEGEEIFKHSSIVDLVFGPQSYHRLPQMLEQLGRKRNQKLIDLDFPTEDKFDALPDGNAPARGAVSRFLTIQEGCDKFCSFCVVPYTRGTEFSRPAAKIFAEAERLITQGAREITLLGQNVNGWRGEGLNGKIWNFTQLLYGFAEKFPTLKRLRYTTSHPRDMDDGLARAHGELPMLMPYLHLPVQSGSDRVLKAMNRGHSADDYLRIIDNLRRHCPEIALSSDFIVGFPGESDQDFADTLRLVRKANYASAFSFQYSPRPGTPASLMDEQMIPPEVKSERLQALQQLLTAQQEAFNRAHIGIDTEILFEKPGRHPGQLVGRTVWLQPAYADLPPSDIGKVIPCRLERLATHSFAARPLNANARAAAP